MASHCGQQLTYQIQNSLAFSQYYLAEDKKKSFSKSFTSVKFFENVPSKSSPRFLLKKYNKTYTISADCKLKSKNLLYNILDLIGKSGKIVL